MNQPPPAEWPAAQRTSRRRSRRTGLASIDRTGAAAGVLTCALGAGAAWLAGYDFATRGVDVAVGAVVVLCLALIAAHVASGD